MLALPGGAYVYQGEELGLAEVEDLPEELLQDPIWERSGHTARGRDGCRVPIPWSGDAPPFGFSPDGVTTWLPQPKAWKDLTAEVEAGDPGSMLELYRAALHLRRGHPALGEGPLTWEEAPEGVLLFSRTPGFVCAVNLSGARYPLPPTPTYSSPAARSTVRRFRATRPCGWPSDPSEPRGISNGRYPMRRRACGVRGRVRPHRRAPARCTPCRAGRRIRRSRVS